MPIRLSSILGLTREQLFQNGVYDSMIDFDSKLHIDPPLIMRSTIPEFANARNKITAYFTELLTLLKHAQGEGALWKQAVRKLTFGEGLNTGLGYSTKSTAGSGIGPKMATRIAHTVKEIITAGVIDPTIFEIVPILEAGIGPDRISDMMSMILEEEFLAYTQRLSNELGVEVQYDKNGRPIVFVPKSILSELPVVEMWEDIGVAAAYNEAVRLALAAVIGKSWSQIAKEYTKQDLRAMLIGNPDLLRELLQNYKTRNATAYDFVVDKLGILLFDVLGENVANEFQLDLQEYKQITPDNVLEVVSKICWQFKNLIENNGLVYHLYLDNGRKRHERFPQLLFFAIADSYCRANNLDLNREINAGTGALDFKVSHGLAKVTVEMKYSSNGNLVVGYEKQLPTYNKAEGVKDEHSVYLVLKVKNRINLKLRLIEQIIAERKKQGIPSPELVIINAWIQPSASNRK